MMDNSKGHLSVIGMTYLKKHKKNVDDSRVSITLYRSGTASGSTGTNMLLLTGKLPRWGFNSKSLMKYGAALRVGNNFGVDSLHEN